ncbi:MAG: hypothetical protein AB1384_04400 [Actinomycetota bacterium]
MNINIDFSMLAGMGDFGQAQIAAGLAMANQGIRQAIAGINAANAGIQAAIAGINAARAGMRSMLAGVDLALNGASGAGGGVSGLAGFNWGSLASVGIRGGVVTGSLEHVMSQLSYGLGCALPHAHVKKRGGGILDSILGYAFDAGCLIGDVICTPLSVACGVASIAKDSIHYWILHDMSAEEYWSKTIANGVGLIPGNIGNMADVGSLVLDIIFE